MQTAPLPTVMISSATPFPSAAVQLPTKTFTPRPTPTPSPTPLPDQAGQRVVFAASDGRALVGYFYPAWKPNAPVVVLMHQFNSNQKSWLESTIIPWMQNWRALDPSNPPYLGAGGKLPEMPHELSFAVFTFDFRGHGESLPSLEKQDYRSNSNGFLLDAQAAYAQAAAMPGVDPNRIIGIGTSIGADAVVDACSEGCVGAFSVSPGSWLDIDFTETVNALLAQGKPVRCIYSTNDSPSPETCLSVSTSDLYKVYGYAGQKHGITFFVPRKMEPDFGADLLEFLQAAAP